MIVFLNTVLFLLAIRAAILMIVAVFGSGAFTFVVILIALLVL